MNKHLAWFVPIAIFALTGPRAFGGDDGPSLFVIPQAVPRTPPSHPSVKKTSPVPATVAKPAPAQARTEKTSPAPVGIDKTVPAPVGLDKTVPAPVGLDKTVPAPVGLDKTVPDVKTPYTGKRVVNRPLTMPSQTPDKLPNRSDERILSGAGPGTIGPYQARLELRRNGTFVVTGNIEGSGTWHQRGQTIEMDSQTSHYEGKLENSTISGTRTFKEREGSEPWMFALNERALEIRLEVQGR